MSSALSPGSCNKLLDWTIFFTYHKQPIIKDITVKPDPGSKNYIQWLRLLLALIVISFVYLYRLDRPLLWGDEADTGIEARNILRCGYPMAYDGRNVSVYENGSQLNRNLLCKKIPWVQYYLAAASLAVFGNNTAGLRCLFAIAGVIAFFPIYFFLKKRVKYPDIITALILLSPQTVLFQRNARYYSILILLYAFLLWHLSTDFKSRKIQFLTALLIFILFFHTHPFAAACCCFSLVLFCLLFRRKMLSVYLFSSCIGFLSWLLWYQSLGPSLSKSPLSFSLIISNFSAWLGPFLADFFTGLLAAVIDLDAVDCLPILLWLALLTILLLKGRKTVLNIFKDPLPSFILLNILVQAVATAAVFGSETGYKYSILRYMPHLVVAAMALSFFMLDSAVKIRGLYVPVCIFAAAFNLLTLSFWTKPYSRNVPVSWLFPVYSEIFRPQNDIWDNVIAKLRSPSSDPADSYKTIVTLPDWTQEVTIFYLGDRYLVPPAMDASSAESKQRIREIIGETSFRRLGARPQWILDTLDFVKTTPAGYKIADIYPSHRARPDDGTRPELTRHTFPQSAIVRNVKLYQLQK